MFVTQDHQKVWFPCILFNWRFFHHIPVFYLWPVVLQASGTSTEWEWVLWLAKGVCEQCGLPATWDAHSREN